MPRRPIVEPRLVDQHHRVVLPKDVLKTLDLRSGSHVHFVVQDGRVEMRRVRLTIE